MRVLAIITARGGSKGLPRKNVLSLLGKPLITYSILAAKQSEIFDAIYVSTEDEEIKRISLQSGANVIDRPAYLATDQASSVDVITHAITTLESQGERFTHFVLLQPTSPLRSSQHLIEAWQQYQTDSTQCLVSVTKEQHTPYKQLVLLDGLVQPLMGWQYLTMPRQQLPDTYRINGAIYICAVSSYLRHQNLFEQPLGIYEMDAISSVDIDTQDDFIKVEDYLKLGPNSILNLKNDKNP